MRSLWVGLLSGVFLLFQTEGAWAQCTMDTECKGDRICESGQCVSPPPTAAAPVAPAEAPRPAPAAAPAPAAPEYQPYGFPPPPPKRHSKGMMAAGIVLTSLTPVALLFTLMAAGSKASCGRNNDDATAYQEEAGYDAIGHRDCSVYDPALYGSLVSATVLLGVGIPMIVIGAKREPARPAAAVTPWVAPSTAGLALRLTL